MSQNAVAANSASAIAKTAEQTDNVFRAMFGLNLISALDNKLESVVKKDDLAPILMEIQQLRSDNTCIQKKLQVMKNRLEFVDKASRRNNIVISGLKSNIVSEALNEFMNICAKTLKVTVNVVEVRKISSGKSFLLSLNSPMEVKAIIDRRRLLVGRKISVDQDFRADERYNSYFIRKIAKNVKKTDKFVKKSNGYSADPSGDNDNDEARIAKDLERKYGTIYGSGRGKSKRYEIDIGLGYSFIDNTEEYDDLIPDEVETIEGGFHINCGALELKKLPTESMTTKTHEIIKMPNRAKKRVISSSSEESLPSSDDDNSTEVASVETTFKSSSSGPADKKFKRTITNPAKTKAAATIPENGGATKKINMQNFRTCLSAGSSSNTPKPSTDGSASDLGREKNAKNVEKTTTVKDIHKAQKDLFLKSQTTSHTKSSNGPVKGKWSGDIDEKADSSVGSDDGGDESDNNSDSNHSTAKEQKYKKSDPVTEGNQGNEKLRSSDTKLPVLEADVLASIVEFRNTLKSKNLIGKKLQFDDPLSESFLRIDDSLLCIDKTERSMVYAHLEFQLSLPRYFFFRKARQLREKEEKLKSKRAFNKLHKAVTETMPTIIASYDAELRRCANFILFHYSATNVNSDQPPKMPKKKFPWNSNLRNLLYDVYQVRWMSYPVLRKKKDTLEDFITTYMSKKVVQIWPKGWMRYKELQKQIEKRKTEAKKNTNHISSPTSAAAADIAFSMAPPPTSSIFSATVAALSQPLKHSNQKLPKSSNIITIN